MLRRLRHAALPGVIAWEFSGWYLLLAAQNDNRRLLLVMALSIKEQVQQKVGITVDLSPSPRAKRVGLVHI